MAIPDYQTLMLPLLRFSNDGNEHSIRELVEPLAGEFRLTQEEIKALNPSGTAKTFYNRVAWAQQYLKQAGLIEPVRRGLFRITSRGQEVLKNGPQKIDVPFLLQFKEFLEFRQRGRPHNSNEPSAELNTENNQQQDPEEFVEIAFKTFRQELEAEILQTLYSCSPSLFERIVVDVLVSMGYGGNRQDAGQAIGGSGDGGIDGLIKEDRLGLDTIYIQAKKWEGTVGRPEVQKFAGALQGMKARKGIFITTSSFSKEAKDYVSHLENKIVLIDGVTLAKYMVDFNVGVSLITTYETKKIDLDYFEE